MCLFSRFQKTYLLTLLLTERIEIVHCLDREAVEMVRAAALIQPELVLKFQRKRH